MRFDSSTGGRSPVGRAAALTASALLMALLNVSVLGAAAQSPADDPPEAGGLSFFSGSQGMSADGPCQIADPTSDTVDGVEHSRGESWGCLTWSTDDPRFYGTSKVIWNQDSVTIPSGRGEIAAVRQRVENGVGAWEGTLTELQVGSQFHEAAGWFIGEGAYDGLAAYVMTDADRVWGVIRPDDGFEAPMAFVEE